MFCIVGALNRESYISALICLDDSVEAFFFHVIWDQISQRPCGEGETVLRMKKNRLSNK